MTRDGALQLFNDLNLVMKEDPVPWQSGPINRSQIMDMVAPFWCDIGSAGVITYSLVEFGRVGTDALFNRTNDCVQKAFPLMTPKFQSNTLLVATWSDVESADGGPQVCFTI